MHSCDVSAEKSEFTTFSHQPRITPIMLYYPLHSNSPCEMICKDDVNESSVVLCLKAGHKREVLRTENPTSNFHVSHVSWSATHHRRWELSSEYAVKMLFILQGGFTQSDLKSLLSSFYCLTSFLDSER